MAALPCCPTLTEIGWATSVAHRFDFAFADFMAADRSQSEEFQETIASLPYIIQKTAGDLLGCAELSKTQLQSHLTGLFEQVEVRTEVRSYADNDSKAMLIFNITAVENGVAYSFVRSIEDIKSRTLTLLDINNG